MSGWTAFPHPRYAFDAATLHLHWPALHVADAEPLPGDAALLAAWAAFHAGDFEAACAQGLALGSAGQAVANRAQLVHAAFVEPSEALRNELYTSMVARCERWSAAEPGRANAHYLLATALDRYALGLSVAQGLAQGIGMRVRSALETALRLRPGHAWAHAALALHHGEVIDKVGSLLGRTQVNSKDAGISHQRQALRLAPDDALVLTHCAEAVLMLEGERALPESEQLYRRAAACEPLDAEQWLLVELARDALED